MTENAATNVVEALARVMADLPGIGRDEHSGQGYNYRGIEQITAHAQKLFAKHGVVWVPRVVERDVREYLMNGKPWTEDHLVVEYDIYGPGGMTDMITVGPIHALGRDNSDKGVNKAMTQAFKYALLQTLCIGDSKDDADRDRAAEADPPEPTIIDRVRDAWNAADRPAQQKLKEWWKESDLPKKTWPGGSLQSVDETTGPVVIEALEMLRDGEVPAPYRIDPEPDPNHDPEPPAEQPEAIPEVGPEPPKTVADEIVGQIKAKFAGTTES